MEKMIRRADLLLIGAAIVLAAAAFFAVRALRAPGAAVRVSVDGEVFGEYSLAEDRTVDILSAEGENVLRIGDGQAWMEEADCPLGLCLAHGRISRSGEVIVCLPHRVTAEVIGGRAAGYDALTG